MIACFQTSLTDEMIVERLTERLDSNLGLIWFAVGVIVYFNILAVVTFLSIRKVWKHGLSSLNIKALPFLITLYTIGFFGAFFAIVSLWDAKPISSRMHRDKWYVVQTELIDIEADRVTKTDSDGIKHTEIYFFGVFQGLDDHFRINRDSSVQYEIGDTVYAVIDYEGDIAFLYDAKEYCYTGNRLQE